MSGARILLITRSLTESEVWRASMVEFQNILCEIDTVDVVTPTTLIKKSGRLSLALQRRLRRAAGVKLVFDSGLNPVHIEQDYDLCFFYAQRFEDLAVFKAIPNWRSRCRRAVCWIEELWLTGIPNNPYIPTLQQFDRVVVPFCNSVEALQKAAGVPCEWQPLGVDALRFHPGENPPERRIDVFSMGRRSEATHEAIRSYAREHNWFYQFDTTHSTKVASITEHRQQIAELIKRSRFFIVNKAKAGDPWQAAGQEELGCRYFEGAAAGAVLVGGAPRSSSFDECFNWPDAVVQVPYDSTEVEKVFNQLEAEPERVAAARQQNVVQSLKRFDWAHRWQDILNSVDLPASEGLRARQARLAEIAAAYGTGRVVPATNAKL